ncbi:hypothetical protein [Deinococcus frigens]|uniref:hypothetical protein n=1 Tax=Deinococcus frigens TaxID=249403 RepID=UPI000496AA86|nr:hypothetical protein [Deinococcus frigens]
MTGNAALLHDFHRAIGLTLPERPAVPTPEVLALRHTLIIEEGAEVDAEFARLAQRLRVGEEVEAADLAALAHELADLLYVTYGAFVTLGIDADAIFAAVHRANMGKAAGPRRADGKQLKPPAWQPADSRAVLERLGQPLPLDP